MCFIGLALVRTLFTIFVEKNFFFRSSILRVIKNIATSFNVAYDFFNR